MKKNVLLSFILLLICSLGFSQSFEKGDILFDAGIGIGIYGTNIKSTITNGNTTISKEEEDGTASVLVPIKAQYGISDKFSVGILIQPENYIIDEDSTSVSEDAQGTAFRLIGTYYIINNDNFNLHAEVGFGSATFNQETENQNGNKSEAEWRGGNFSLGLGLRYYFSDNIGFFANTAYSSYSFDLDEITVNGTSFDVDGWEAQFRGAEITVGLALKF